MQELAVTEHLFRFRQARGPARGILVRRPGARRRCRRPWPTTGISTPRPTSMTYVRCAQEAKDAGLPVVIGLEVDYLPGADGRGGRPAGRLPLRRPAGLGALAGRLAFRRHRRPAADGRVVGPPGGRLLGGVHAGARGAGGIGCLRRPGPSRSDQGGGVRAGRAGRVVGSHGRGGGIVGHGGRALLGGLAQAGGGAVPGTPPPRAVRRPRRAVHDGLRRPPSRARGRSGGGAARPAGRGRGRLAAGVPGPGAAPGRRGQPASTASEGA